LVRDVCAVCNEKIYLKICPLCLTDKIELWLERNKISLTKEFRFEVRQFLDRVKRYNKLTCNICRADTEAAVCPNCFNERICAWLVRKDKVLATEFMRNLSVIMGPVADIPRFAQ